MRNFTLKYGFLLLCLAALCPRAAAQQADYSPSPISNPMMSYSEVTFSGRIIDSLTREPLPGAVISVVQSEIYYKKEIAVRNYITDKNGLFRFTSDRGRDNRMEISFLGYKIRTVWLNADQPQIDLGDVWMAESAQSIDDVIVKARMQLYKMKGDTTIYIPKAIKTMEGDKALEILRNMPGVEVSENGTVTVQGKPVERTYVNNRLLFGEDPKTALNQLAASEVASIQAYDEIDEEDALRHNEKPKKRKVLNVTTFEKFSRSIAANAYLEAGTDFEQDVEGHRPMRYAGAADVSYYSEEMQIAVKGLANNVEDSQRTAGSKNKASTEASISGRVGKTHRYGANYQYNHVKTANQSIGDFTYFPSEYFHSKRAADTTRIEQRQGVHLLSANYVYSQNNWVIGTDLSASIINARGNGQQINRTEQDQALLLATVRNNNSSSQGNSFNGIFSASKRFKNQGYLSTSFNFRQSDIRTMDLRRESQTTAEGTRPSDLRITSARPERTFSGTASYNLPDSRRLGSLSFTLSADISESKDRKLYIDPQTGILQVALSDDAIDRLTTWKISPNYSFRRKSHDLNLKLDYTLAPRNYRNLIFGTSDKTLYQMLDGMASYTYSFKTGNLSFGLFNSHMLPQSSILSSRIDDNNPLFLSSGNPSLRPSKNYGMSITGSFTGKEGSFDFGINASLTTDPFIQKLTYFETDTPLPQYDNYVALAGSTLSTPINGSNTYSIAPALGYSSRIVPLKCFINIRASYHYLNTEEYTYLGFGRAQDHRGGFDLSLTSNFSSLVRITLASRTEAGWYRAATGYRDQNFREQLNASLRWDLLKRCIFTSSYTLEINRFQSTIANSDNHILNLSFGCRLLKRKGTLSFNAYDILNQTTSLKVNQNVQGVSYTWRRMYGSYFTFAFEYKFNKRN